MLQKRERLSSPATATISRPPEDPIEIESQTDGGENTEQLQSEPFSPLEETDACDVYAAGDDAADDQMPATQQLLPLAPAVDEEEPDSDVDSHMGSQLPLSGCPTPGNKMSPAPEADVSILTFC